jgi:hypothetical protein
VTYVIEHTQAIAVLLQGGVLFVDKRVINGKSANTQKVVTYMGVLVI